MSRSTAAAPKAAPGAVRRRSIDPGEVDAYVAAMREGKPLPGDAPESIAQSAQGKPSWLGKPRSELSPAQRAEREAAIAANEQQSCSQEGCKAKRVRLSKYCRAHRSESRARFSAMIAEKKAERVERGSKHEASWTAALAEGEAALKKLGKAKAASQPEAYLRPVARTSSFARWLEAEGHVGGDSFITLPSEKLAYAGAVAKFLKAQGYALVVEFPTE